MLLWNPADAQTSSLMVVEDLLSAQHCLQVVFLELCSERRGILTMTKQEVETVHIHAACPILTAHSSNRSSIPTCFQSSQDTNTLSTEGQINL